MSSVERICRLSKEPFSLSGDEIAACEHFSLPLPTLCPRERYRQQLAFLNEGSFFKRRCSITNESMLSVYSPEVPFPLVSLRAWDEGLINVSCREAKLGDGFKGNFLEELFTLWTEVPRPARNSCREVDSQAVHNCLNAKSSIYCFRSIDIENCFYCVGAKTSANCGDCLYIEDCRNCYDCLDCVRSTRLKWSFQCVGCSDSFFLSSCRECRDCLFCANLVGKQYCVFNQEVSAEKYAEILGQWKFSNRQVVELAVERFSEFLNSKSAICSTSAPQLGYNDSSCFDCENAIDSFFCHKCYDIMSCHELSTARHCLEGFGFGAGLENSAQFVFVGGGAKDILNCIECYDEVNNLEYCFMCERSSHLLGCVGLREKQYCILNKQYTRDDYFKLRDAIVSRQKEEGKWGSFFSMAFSSFAYNHSAANVRMPLSKIQAAMFNFLWEDEAEISPRDVLKEEGEKLSDICDTLDELLGKDLENLRFLCEISGKVFRIYPQELKLYQELNIAPPSRSFEVRHGARISRLPLPAGEKNARSRENADAQGERGLKQAQAIMQKWRNVGSKADNNE